MVNPQVQRKILGLAALFPALITTLHLIIQKFILESLTDRLSALLANEEQSKDVILIIEQMGLAMNLGVLMISIISVVIIYTVGVRLTHKIAGPITAAMNYLERIKNEGVTGPLRFRDGDDFNELSASLNETLLYLGLKYNQKIEKEITKN